METWAALIRSQLSAYFDLRSLEELLEAQRQLALLFPVLQPKKTMFQFKSSLKHQISVCLKNASGHPTLPEVIWTFCQASIKRWHHLKRKEEALRYSRAKVTKAKRIAGSTAQ